MNAATPSDVQLEDATMKTLETSGLQLRALESAEMIHVGGGYCAADY
jgi:hypothetical protein